MVVCKIAMCELLMHSNFCGNYLVSAVLLLKLQRSLCTSVRKRVTINFWKALDCYYFGEL